MYRNRAYRRYHRNRCINRKLRLLRSWWGLEEVLEYYYDVPSKRGQLAKGKIHCSCWMCSIKTRAALPIRDIRKMQYWEMDSSGRRFRVE